MTFVKNKSKLLILGVIPPPIGGVTIHVQRLIANLEKKNVDFIFLDYKKDSFRRIFMSIISSKIVHLHAFHPLLIFFFTILSRIFNTRIIVTIHGELGQYNKLLNSLNILALKVASIVTVENQKTFNSILRYTKNARLIPSFIPPVEEKPSNIFPGKQLLELKKKYEMIFCTNAYKFCHDNLGKETYGITDLVRIFAMNSANYLIIADPSGMYSDYYKKDPENIPENIWIQSFRNNEFIDIIKSSDCLIRATTTDGDSLSIKEALYYRKQVIASDCVDRHPDVILYKSQDFQDLGKKIHNFVPGDNSFNEPVVDAVDLFIKVYSELNQ